MHILLVEHHKDSLSLIARRLKAAAGKALRLSRIRVEQAGFAHWGSNRADAVVIELPTSADGSFARLSQYLQSKPHTPVVVVAETDLETATAFQMGAQEFLLKSEASGKALLRAIHNARVRTSSVITDRSPDQNHNVYRNGTSGDQKTKGHTQELVSAKTRIEAILNGSSSGILLFHSTAGIQHANVATYRLFRAEGNDFSGRQLADLLSPECRCLLDEVIDDVVSQNSVQQIDVTALRLDGSTFDVQISIAPIEYPDTLGEYFVCTVQDITARKELEFSLLRYADELYDLYNQAPCGYYSTDTNGVIIQINDTLLSWLGYSRDVVIHEMTIDRILTPKSAEICAAIYEDFIKKGWLKDLEVEFVRRDGTVFSAMISATAAYDENGQYAMARSTVFDITDRKLADNALRESEEKFRQIAENIDQTLFVFSEDGTQVQYVSPAYEAITGRTRQSLSNGMASLLDCVHPEDRTRIRLESNLGCLGTRPHTSSEFRIVQPDGRIRWAQVRTFPILDDAGHVYRRIGIMEDITDRKNFEEILERALQQEKELSDLKSRFVSMASHEFRTPLATILAATESLSSYRQKMDETQIDARLDKIREQVSHMKQIMDDVLQLTRIQAGRVDYRPVEADLDTLCRDIVDEFHSQSEYENRIIYSCDSAPIILSIDPRLIRQAITNLLSNALKYSAAEDKVTMDVSKKGNQVTLRIRDEGIGIPLADQKHLFEPFHRASNVGVVAGTGLGLNIALQAISLHCGSIEITSAPNEGTTVVVIIPLAA